MSVYTAVAFASYDRDTTGQFLVTRTAEHGRALSLDSPLTVSYSISSCVLASDFYTVLGTLTPGTDYRARVEKSRFPRAKRVLRSMSSRCIARSLTSFWCSP